MFIQRFKSSIGCFYFFLMLNIKKTNTKNESFCWMLFGPWYIFFFEGPAWPVYCGWTFVVLFLAWRWGNGKTRDDSAGEQTDTLTQQQMKVAIRFPAFVSLLSFNHKHAVYFNRIQSTHFPACYVHPSIFQHCASCTPCCCGPGHYQRSQGDPPQPHPLSTGCQFSFFVLCNMKFWSFLAGPWNSHVKRELELLKNFAVHSCLMCHFLLEQ